MNLGLENYVKYNFPKGKKVFVWPVWVWHLYIETGTSEKDRLCYSCGAKLLFADFIEQECG